MLDWVGFGFGLAIVLLTAGSVVGTLVVPRRVRSVIAKSCDQAVDRVFALICSPTMPYGTRDAVLAWQSPMALMLRLAVWLGLFYAGYALMLLPSVAGRLGRAFSESGSSMFTLGYSAPHGVGMSMIDYFAAFSGLIVVALQIGYLPALYASFNRRETEVTLLVSRAGLPAWGPELLARTRFGIVGNIDVGSVLDELFTIWERWSAEVAESHTTYLSLAQFRSPRPLSHWVTSLVAIMDAAAMHLSLAPSTRPNITARLCVRMGFTALAQVGQAMHVQVDEDPDPDHPLTAVTFEEFAAAADMLRALDYPIERTNEQAWPHFRGWRVNYEATALALAYATNAPPALWTGPRRWPSTPMPPNRPANRVSRDVNASGAGPSDGAVKHERPESPVAGG
jgi:hypothetical protein